MLLLSKLKNYIIITTIKLDWCKLTIICTKFFGTWFSHKLLDQTGFFSFGSAYSFFVSYSNVDDHFTGYFRMKGFKQHVDCISYSK